MYWLFCHVNVPSMRRGHLVNTDSRPAKADSNNYFFYFFSKMAVDKQCGCVVWGGCRSAARCCGRLFKA